MLSAFKTINFSIVVCMLFIGTAYATSSKPASYHYSGDLKIDPETGHIAAAWQIELLDPELTNLTFALRSTLSGIGATGPELQEVNIRPADMSGELQLVTLTLEKTGGPRTVALTYSGVLLPEPMENGINHIGPRYIELNVDSFWHPIDVRFNQYLTSDVRVYVPVGWQGVTGGATTYEEDGSIRFVNSIPALDVSFTLSPEFRKTELPDFTIYDLRADSASLESMITAARNCYAFLQPLYGTDNPLPPGRFVLHDRPESGYARYNYIALSQIARREQPNITGFLCHELTHYWSRHGNFSTVENWMNESFAVYSELMAIRHYHGVDVFQVRIKNLETRVSKADLPPIYDGLDMSRRPYLVNYGTGPLALRKLEERIGEEMFLTFIKAYMAGAIATTPELIDLLGQIAGDETKVWFAELLAE